MSPVCHPSLLSLLTCWVPPVNCPGLLALPRAIIILISGRSDISRSGWAGEAAAHTQQRQQPLKLSKQALWMCRSISFDIFIIVHSLCDLWQVQSVDEAKYRTGWRLSNPHQLQLNWRTLFGKRQTISKGEFGKGDYEQLFVAAERKFASLFLCPSRGEQFERVSERGRTFLAATCCANVLVDVVQWDPPPAWT